MKKLLTVSMVLIMVFVGGCAPVAKAEPEPAVTASLVSQDVTSSAAEPTEAGAGTNMIHDGEFTANDDGWYTYLEGGSAEKSVINGELLMSISAVGSVTHGAQLYQDGFGMDKGCKYKLSFDMRSTAARTVNVRIQKNGDDYKGYLDEIVPLTTEMKNYVLEFEMADPSDPAPRFAINMGKPQQGDDPGAHQIYLDNVVLEFTDDSGRAASEETKAKMLSVNINQLGYRPSSKKLAVFNGEDTKFEVVDTKTNAIVFTGDITGEVKNSFANEVNRYGDFTLVKTPGTYLVRTAKLGDSFPFEIGEDVYKGALKQVANMFYMQRCGSDLTKDNAEEWAHTACHTAPAAIFGTDIKLDVSGGWHDAGDYGRYVVPGAKAAADLMLAWQLNPNALCDPLSSTVPELISEIRYELDWMLKMQDSKSGGVYHKVTTANFEGEVMPETVTEPLIISPISTAATADFAAVMAMASTVYKPFDAAFAANCLAAAEKAWKYRNTNSSEAFTNPSGIVTGEYGDSHAADERFWAACELLKATGKAEYNEFVVKACASQIPGGLGWADVGGYGCYAYLTAPSAKVDKASYDKIKDTLLKSSDELVKKSKADGYLISLDDYNWGSNMNAANNAMQLILTGKIAPNAQYNEAAENHLHYLYGRNSLSYSFVTGFGSQYPVSPHHRPSTAIGKTIPGMLVGGPNSALEDPYAQAVLKDAPAAKCYADNKQSYSTNEVAIYWNSPLVFLMAEFA